MVPSGNTLILPIKMNHDNGHLTETTQAVGRIRLLGCWIHRLPSYEAGYALLRDQVRSDAAACYVTVNNAHTLVLARRNDAFRRIINGAFLSIADGRPLSIIGRALGAQHMQRIFGPTLMEKTIDWGQKDGLRHFFFGNTPENLNKMAEVISQKYPDARVAGMISPPFRPLTGAENQSYLQEINKSRADIIWVSLGAPKQENWIHQHHNQLDHGIFIGIGAGFNYLNGTIKHAPRWMKHYALEWLYRLFQEPLRLTRRYLVYNTLFLLYIIRDALLHPHFFFVESRKAKA